VIFEADTPAGKLFDVALLWAILASVVIVMLESVESFRSTHGYFLRAAEWVFTVAFTLEYALRLISVKRPLRYAKSFFGLVDLLSIAPTYLSLFIPGAQSLLVIRALRLLRIFRVLKLVHFLNEASELSLALRRSSRKISVFLGVILSIVAVMGALMYLIEGSENGFTSIPRAMYWAVVTMTTVGYGNVAPQTVLGQFVAACLMIAGYAIIAVPTGIVSAELSRKTVVTTQSCRACSKEGHDPDAQHCKFCGEAL